MKKRKKEEANDEMAARCMYGIATMSDEDWNKMMSRLFIEMAKKEFTPEELKESGIE